MVQTEPNVTDIFCPRKLALAVTYLLNYSHEFQQTSLDRNNVLMIRETFNPEAPFVTGIETRWLNLVMSKLLNHFTLSIFIFSTHIINLKFYSIINNYWTCDWNFIDFSLSAIQFKKKFELTFPVKTGLKGLETCLLRTLSSERGESLPDLFRNSLDVLALAILHKQKNLLLLRFSCESSNDCLLSQFHFSRKH